MSAPRPALGLLLAAALAVVARLTLTPSGTGYAVASPVQELHWYADGLSSPATVVQLLGNLLLLAVPAFAAVRLWPRLGRPVPLVAVALAAGVAIELAQYVLPLGRVVSPLDALLNAAGAVAAGALAAQRRRTGPASIRVRNRT
ncbi:VanZ family protein [Blastococcus sp. TF02A-30]|uniref:VanZ family protein n=1 Tax=Blastococcus sp. TF02A-30 TaxID=2250580 RepID=UPI000DEB0A7C|nr:VanZ family protein [Blastococcus sp. TF02A-30]RBY87801.1 VanZ family protein [Blastococcus sp. TF02A-30]